ncbi:MAG TPA: phosphoribosyl-AMP cyclohydrolase [Hyphomicrobiales bacterium]|nr:phosphoribosyl-AMP cyclohydrolase [Hyphomicrobiales bacterium]
MQTDWLDTIRFDSAGLVPVIAQDWESGVILMQAYANREALQLTVRENRAIYWSRSKQRLWRKGEESGHVQILHAVLVDCDADSLIYVVEQLGGIACHTGRASCYYRRLLPDGSWETISEVLKAPEAIYAADHAPKD